ncbi:NUDIX domain-containing protein [Balneolaceae bacterium ANBcel3]|nr:NUDIX domain-containing protein [Balneolaceae bacterium ANBcel3]
MTAPLSQRIRLRVNGLLADEGRLLMVRLYSPVVRKMIWMPPGGELLFGESMAQGVSREMKEETGLTVEAGPLWYVHEVQANGIHAVEFYFKCRKQGGALITGTDPEYGESEQIIEETAYLDYNRLKEEDIYPEYLRYGLIKDLSDENFTPPRVI